MSSDGGEGAAGTPAVETAAGIPVHVTPRRATAVSATGTLNHCSRDVEIIAVVRNQTVAAAAYGR